jgi:carbamoylphosphate synthase small subunit
MKSVVAIQEILMRPSYSRQILSVAVVSERG